MLKVVISGLSAKCEGPSELLHGKVSRSLTPVEAAAPDVLSPAPEEQTDHPSTPITPYNPVKVFGFLLQHLASATEKVSSLHLWHASISKFNGVISSVLQCNSLQCDSCMYVRTMLCVVILIVHLEMYARRCFRF